MRIWLAVAPVVLAAQSGLAHAEVDKLSGAPLLPRPPEKTSPILDHFYVLAAFYSPVIHTDVRIDPTVGVPPGTLGTPVNAERDLGLKSRMELGKVEFAFRLRERHKMRVDYYQADRSAGHTLANTIVFGDQTFLAGQTVQTTINWRSFGLTYSYSLYRSDRFEVGTGLGLYFLQTEAIGQIPATGQQTDKSAAEPVPTLPLDLTWAISRRWAVTARGNYVKAKISGFDGSYTDLHGDLQYRWNPNFSLGLGFSSMRISLSGDSGSIPGVVSMSYQGPEAFVRFSY
ncbi:MAG TPA: hypothetical protein VLV25_02300 [Steroidobacteraceae bacterium]|nr:hypothetical protein [Steroidobacteraceae bacterium]